MCRLDAWICVQYAVITLGRVRDSQHAQRPLSLVPCQAVCKWLKWRLQMRQQSQRQLNCSEEEYLFFLAHTPRQKCHDWGSNCWDSFTEDREQAVGSKWKKKQLLTVSHMTCADVMTAQPLMLNHPPMVTGNSLWRTSGTLNHVWHSLETPKSVPNYNTLEHRS